MISSTGGIGRWCPAEPERRPRKEDPGKKTPERRPKTIVVNRQKEPHTGSPPLTQLHTPVFNNRVGSSTILIREPRAFLLVVWG
nr:hypothetical protein Q903MT_gene6103 [Picea sitchensis]